MVFNLFSPSSIILPCVFTKQKQHPVVDVTGAGSKIQCYKEQYCIGTWNARPMIQGKLEVVKQEMARVPSWRAGLQRAGVTP